MGVPDDDGERDDEVAKSGYFENICFLRMVPPGLKLLLPGLALPGLLSSTRGCSSPTGLLSRVVSARAGTPLSFALAALRDELILRGDLLLLLTLRCGVLCPEDAGLLECWLDRALLEWRSLFFSSSSFIEWALLDRSTEEWPLAFWDCDFSDSAIEWCDSADLLRGGGDAEDFPLLLLLREEGGDGRPASNDGPFLPLSACGESTAGSSTRAPITVRSGDIWPLVEFSIEKVSSLLIESNISEYPDDMITF